MQTNTEILHAIPSDPLTGAISVPIYQTATFVQSAPGVHQGYDYARTNNPTRRILESLLQKLEEGSGASAFSSGLAAIDAVLKLLKPGDEILAVQDIYGGAYRLFTQLYANWGIKVRFANGSDTDSLIRAISNNTRLIWVESPTNPTLKLYDIQAIAFAAREHNCLLCVDNTFATPLAQKPILLGADLVLHSATKYLSGHSDLIAGAVISASPELAEKIRFIQNASGAILGPFDSWLVIRGIETLALRVKQHAENALLIAQWLSKHPAVAQVNYPGLKNHPDFEIGLKQQKFFGGVLSFDLKDDRAEQAIAFIKELKLFKLAESLGGVKSLVCLPSEMTHKTIPVERRQEIGISHSLIRLSVGIEDAQDLIDDLDQAFEILNNKIHHIKINQYVSA